MTGYKLPNCQDDCFCPSLNLTVNNALENCKGIGLQPCEACNQLLELEARILSAHDILVDLKAKYQAAKAKVNNKHDRFSGPIPVEVVSRIFESYIEAADDEVDDTHIPKDPAHGHHDQPLEGYMRSGKALAKSLTTLTSVCSNWQHIARTTPSLWTSIVIPIDGDMTSSGQSMPEMVEAWLGRSGGLPVNITIYEVDEYIISKPSIKPIVELVLKYITRWSSLRVHSPNSEKLLFDGFAASPASARVLQHVEFAGDTFSAPISDVPTLRTLRMFGQPSQGLGNCWQYLTVLRFDMIAIRDAFTVLCYAIRVVDCTLWISGNRENLPKTPLKKIVRPHLRNLAFGGANHTYRGGLPFSILDIILRYVEAPSLDTLVLKEFWGGSSYLHGPTLFSEMVAIFREWIQQTVLTKVTITGVNHLRDNEFLQIFEGMPNTVKHVIVSSAERRLLGWNLILDLFFQDLHKSNNVLLPNLNRLEYWGCQNFQWMDVVNTLRMRGATSVDGLRLDFHLYTGGRYIDARKHDLDHQIVSEILSLKALPGLCINITDADDNSDLLEKVLQAEK